MASDRYREWEGAADRMLSDLEKAQALNKAEMEAVRRDLARSMRDEASRGADALTTLRMGTARVLVPGSENLRRANITSERVRERFSNFKLSFLDKDQARRFVEAGSLSAVPVGHFVRQSKRLARAARVFLGRIGELEPTLREEVDETLRQIDDAQNDLLKLEVRSFTNVRENLLRTVNGRMTRHQAGQAIETYDINRHLWNLSLLAHPEGVVRAMLANASDRMAERVSETKTTMPKRMWVVVGAGPNAVSKMRPDSRVAHILWRTFQQGDLDRRYAEVNTNRTSATSWRGLGFDYQSPEFYVPVPPEIAEETKEAMRERRREVMRQIEEQGKREGAGDEDL